MARRAWSWDETLMAFALYLMLPPKECDDSGEDVQALAAAIGRTPSAVSLKIWNIAAHDKNRIALGRKGMSHGSRLDEEVWERFEEEGDVLLAHAIDLLDQRVGGDSASGETRHYLRVPSLEAEGTDRLVIATARVNQQYFRNSLLENYEHKCCVTNLGVEGLLVASHIKPWSEADPKTERLAASNGLLLNALHDKAFDRGYMTIDDQFKIVISPKVRHDDASDEWLWRYDGSQIRLPRIESARPRHEFIEYHNDVIFQH